VIERSKCQHPMFLLSLFKSEQPILRRASVSFCGRTLEHLCAMETPPDHQAPSFEVKAASSSYRPDAKAQRYDRQLRLWAASGQAALESCHVLVVNGTATATSILKNLVLPGIGHFTVLDSAQVDQADLGNNFFLQPGTSKVGDNRAEEVIKYLGELNDGVKKEALVMVSSQLLS